MQHFCVANFFIFISISFFGNNMNAKTFIIISVSYLPHKPKNDILKISKNKANKYEKNK